MEEEQRKQGRYLREVIEFHHRWPTINPDDVQGAASSSPPGPKVRLAPYSPTYWPRDGSVLLSVHSTATGDEVKRGWREIKRGLRLNQRRVRIGERSIKIRIYDMYQAGFTFPQIAKAVKKSRSTVYALYDSVVRDIQGVGPGSQRGLDPNFDLNEHVAAGCPSCNKGRLCALVEEFYGLKEFRGREVLYGDIGKAEVRQLRLAQGRKLPRSPQI